MEMVITGGKKEYQNTHFGEILNLYSSVGALLQLIFFK